MSIDVKTNTSSMPMQIRTYTAPASSYLCVGVSMRVALANEADTKRARVSAHIIAAAVMVER